MKLKYFGNKYVKGKESKWLKKRRSYDQKFPNKNVINKRNP
jgi:hypothetical protein